ncbi:MAG: phosphoribosylanthranilate isomerase [Candidatus Binatia bacterium]|nr:phosphoribosylanthranilate isomerase [Candidatus Binatia bacterium]
MSVRVKICGVTRPADAEAAVSLGADMVGLNFYEKSKRYLERSAAVEVARAIPDPVWRVGVFVNASRDEIEELRVAVGLTAIQLHGDEPPEMAENWPCPVIRTVWLRGPTDVDRVLETPATDFLLCEGPAGGGYGGSGETFDWSWGEGLPAERLFVAGGLEPTNVAGAIRALRPFAVDAASGVESSPGIKDITKMRELIHNAKAA